MSHSFGLRKFYPIENIGTKLNRPYSHLADLYNHLMKQIDYKDWANYLHILFQTYVKSPKYVLELAAGTGNITRHLRKYYSQIIVSDFSNNMLKKNKHGYKDSVCCDMKYLPFKKQFDIIFSTFDSVNYLTSPGDLKCHFEQVKYIMEDHSIYAFDVSLMANSRKNVRQLNRSGKFNKIKYRQKSEFDETTKIHTNTFMIEYENGDRIIELHKQKIYDFYLYFELLESLKLFVVDCFESFTFEDARSDCERVQFIVRKNNAQL